MKKACVSTYCEWTSYGSVLQAIGLSRTLEDLGWESFIVRDEPPSANCRLPLFAKNPKQVVKNILSRMFHNEKEKRYRKTIEFMKTNTKVLYYNDYDVLKKNVPQADAYLAGSDQIWHPSLCKPSFFLGFVPEGKPRLSYAASMGISNVPRKKERQFAELISGITSLSVREAEAAHILEQQFGRKASVHIDPTFLRSREEWQTYEKEYVVGKPYVLVYPLFWDSKLNRQLRLLHKRTGMEIVAITTEFPRNFATKYLRDVDPGEFLYLIDHAEAVVTSSFHGVALSVLFNKKLAAIVDPRSPARIENLLRILSLETSEILDVLQFDMTKYDSVNRIVREEKEKSICYLKEILNSNE